jgi:23S rRNA pseudouridine955/2504/2580 synthase
MALNFDQVQFFDVSDENQAQRIDNYLISKLKGVPKSKIYKIVRKGEVRVNKKRVKPEYKLQLGDNVRVPPIRIEESKAAPINTNHIAYLEQAILYEDERLLVINKPSGLAVHGGSGLNYGMIEALRALRPNAPFLELVHRLDRDTSGCIIVAKKRSALRHLHEQLRNNQMDKTYHALVKGEWPVKRTKVSAKLQKNQLQSGERMVFADENGKASETRFKRLNVFEHASLVEAKPITGRTHQIRVHCQFAGHNIANDPKYGDDVFTESINNMGCKRLFLHAKNIRFIHPLSEKVISFDAPYDNALSGLVKRLNAEKHQ